jgi:predicted DNA binding CopG/RHH family protein
MKKKISKSSSRGKKVDPLDQMLEHYDYEGPTKNSKIVKPKKKPFDATISLRLPSDVLERTRAAAEEKGMGYHTLIRLIVMEHLSEYESQKNA